MIKKQEHIAIIYSDPLPTTWERQKRQEFIAESSQNQPSDIDEVAVIERLKSDILGEVEVAREVIETKGRKASVIGVRTDLKEFLRMLPAEPIDCVLNFFESSNGDSLQEMQFASILEFLGLTYTGSASFTLGFAVHKNLVKDLLLRNGIPTPQYWLGMPGGAIPNIPEKFFPLIVKPSREDASIGIDDDSVVYHQADLAKRVAFVHEQFYQRAIIEQFIDGREINISILGNELPMALPISEIDYSDLPAGHQKIVTYEAKWAEESVPFLCTKPVCPAQLDPLIEARAKQVALEAYRVVGCRDYARVDLRLDAAGHPYVLEVNPNPDISPDAGFPRSARVGGIPYDELINTIVDLALARRVR